MLRIELLGGFRVAVGERVVAPGAWRLRKARGLIKLLALAPGHRLHRERLQDLLWPALAPEAAANNLHQALHGARRALGPAPAASPYLGLQEDTLALCPAGSLWTDVEAFEAAAATARRTREAAAYHAAVGLYGGELLPEDPYEDWAAARREALRGLYLTLLLERAQVEEARGELGLAREALTQIVASEPTHEEAHAGLMRLYALAGQRHQAVRQYEQLREALRRGLDAEPEPATHALYQQIVAGSYATTPGRVSAAPTRATRTMLPETRYARSGDVNIAYQVVGDGPIDLVFVMGWVSNLDYYWEEPRFARFLRRLASFSRLILFDKRGMGLSDRAVGLPTLEERMDDVRAVMDAVGSERAALIGLSEGGAMCALFAATYPERTSGIVLIATTPRAAWAPDYPWGRKPEMFDRGFEELIRDWGTLEWAARDLEQRAPSVAHDERFAQWWATYVRMSASPGAARAISQMNRQNDARHLLPAIRVPTLILHRTDDRSWPVDGSQYMAARIPDARYVELPGGDHLPWVGDQDAMLDEVEQFLTGVRRGPELDRVLASVLFTDIVDSTRCAAQLGDRRWRELLETHHAVVRRELERHRGREVDTAGDGFLATFDGPARGIRCACAVVDAVRPLGLEVRAGLHTGECEVIGDRVGGIAVHIGARVAALASPSEVLVSSTVKDLVAGSGIRFVDHGSHVLKGVPDEWRLFAVDQASAS